MDEIDISKISDKLFKNLVIVTTYANERLNNGIIYVNPAFREIEGQTPHDIACYSMHLDERGKPDWKEAKSEAERTCTPVSFVLRDKSGRLEKVFYLPKAISETEPHIKDITREIEILYKAKRNSL
jgi:hypothetical protein